MKYYWIASTIEIKTRVTKNTLCACKMKGEGNMRSLTIDKLRKLLVVYCSNAELGKIPYGCTFVDRNKYVLYCDAVNITHKM